MPVEVNGKPLSFKKYNTAMKVSHSPILDNIENIFNRRKPLFCQMTKYFFHEDSRIKSSCKGSSISKSSSSSIMA
jgi:hypothetical protein